MDDPLNPRTFKVSALVRAARGQVTQAAFARELGDISQSQVCKYESGAMDPPSRVIEKCFKVVAERTAINTNEKELVARIEQTLCKPEMAGLKNAFALILDALSSQRSVKPKDVQYKSKYATASSRHR